MPFAYILILIHWPLYEALPGTVYKLLQKIPATLMTYLYVTSQRKECEMFPGVNFQEAVEHLIVWLPLELMEL